MKHVCMIVDGVNSLTTTQKSKVERILTNTHKLSVIINAYNPYFERYYFETPHSCSNVKDSYLIKLNCLREKLYEDYGKQVAEIHVETYFHKDLAVYLRQYLDKHTLLVIATAELTNRHTVHFEIVRTVKNPTIMLSGRSWAKQLRAASAVDPVHRNDELATYDKKIVETTRSLLSHIKGEHTIIHSSYVPPQLHEFSKQIKRENISALDRFLSNSQFVGEGAQLLLTGNPETAIPNFVDSTGTNILTMGSIARNDSERWYLGSTSEYMLRKLPCDLLFVHIAGKQIS